MPEPASASDVLPPDNLVFSDLHPRGSDKRTEILSGQLFGVYYLKLQN